MRSISRRQDRTTPCTARRSPAGRKITVTRSSRLRYVVIGGSRATLPKKRSICLITSMQVSAVTGLVT